jgi:hypothetical protein
LAPRIFHFDCHPAASAVFYLDFDAAVKALIPGVLRHSQCAVEKTFATEVFHRNGHYSAPLVFHPVSWHFRWLLLPIALIYD